MATFVTRQCLVDPQGMAGTHTTIGAAIATAVAGGADATSNFWQILVGPGTYTEDITLPSGIRLQGCGRLSVIRGTVEVYPVTHLSDFYITQIASSAYVLGVRHTGGAGSIYVSNCIIENVNQNVDSLIAAIEVSGTATGGTSRISNCWIYARNGPTSSAPNAKAVVVRLLSGFASFVEIWASHLKTSVGAGGVGESICVKNETTGSLVGTIYIGSCDWTAIHAGVGSTPDPILLDNSNPTHNGATLDVSHWNTYGKVPLIRTAFTGSIANPTVGVLTHSRYQHGLLPVAGTPKLRQL